uniref:Uncharacterized protein n=1 Tax=Bactrocera latifrons TaxID=174628 RepID=A0A0K8W4R2_BACLA
MIRLLATNCNRHLTQQLPKFQQVPQTQLNGIRDFSGHLKNANKLLRVVEQQARRVAETGGKRILNTRLILLSGCGATLGLGLRTYLAFARQAQCESNRLAGVIQKTLQQEDNKFDWRRFWAYLEPHLWELLGAIAVRICCEYSYKYYIVFGGIITHGRRGILSMDLIRR